MSTALIDRTLSYLPINPEQVDKDDLTKYIEGVLACGADYIEINSTVLKLLVGRDLSDKFIFRITSASDIKLSASYRFAYVSLPFALSPFFKVLAKVHSIIAEIQTNEYAVLSDLLNLKNDPLLKYVSMLRLTGNVCVNSNSAEELVKWYKQNMHIPLDVCPLNTMLTGAGDSISLLRSHTDALSLSFGRNYYYSSLEDFLINQYILKRSYMPQEKISALCSTSIAFMRVFRSLPCGMERLTSNDNIVTSPVYDIEKGVVYRPFKAKKKHNPEEDNAIERQIKSIGLEKEIENAIIEMLKKTNYSFYQNIIKRNMID